MCSGKNFAEDIFNAVNQNINIIYSWFENKGPHI